MNLLDNRKAFTLIEIIIVMIIIGILVLLAAPRYLNYVKDARVRAMQVDCKTLKDGAMLYSIDQSDDGTDRGDYPVNGEDQKKIIAEDDNAKAILATIGRMEGYGMRPVTNKPDRYLVYQTIEGVEELVIYNGKNSLGLKKLDKELLKGYVKTTKNPIGDYVISTDGPCRGEVFYIGANLENSKDQVFVSLLGTEMEIGEVKKIGFASQ